MNSWWLWLAEMVWWLRVLISIAAFVGGALVAGWLLGLLMHILGREARRRTKILARLGGGMAAGLAAWLLLQLAPPGSGLGGGGTGGDATVQRPPAVGDTNSEEPPPPLPPEQTRGPIAQATLAGRWVLRIKLLGAESSPQYEAPDKYFAVIDALPVGRNQVLAASPPLPREPLNAAGVLALVQQLQSEGTLEAVELHVTPYSTSLRHNQVGQLRRLLRDAKVRFDYPDPDKPVYSRLVEK
ncbi:hypothetical protein HRbin36_01365 [bacterium HR36]|nr:hypothetical protein HRbin36_01365 [bacterium HR36]